jgi:hypothetical protein
MAKAAVKMQRTASTSASVGNITAPASGMRRIKLLKGIFGSEGTVADNPFLWTLQRCTTTGTRTGVTPRLLDPSDAAVVATAGENHSVEPTYTASEFMDHIPLNQRGTFAWYPTPGGEPTIPATANNGIGFQTPTAGGVAVTASIHIHEE